MGIEKLIRKFLWHRSRPYKKITKLMKEISPEDLRILVARMQELQKQGKGA